jgi:hypothetical protein
MNMTDEINKLRNTLRLQVENQDVWSDRMAKTGRDVEIRAARLMLQTEDRSELAWLRLCHENGSKLRDAARTGSRLVAA